MRFLRYPGGKSRKSVREKIISYFPDDYTYLIEPMVGGGLFWYTNKKTNILISDMDEDLMSVYYALKNRPDDIINKVRKIPPYEKNALDKKRIQKQFNHFKNPSVTHDKALRYLFMNRTSFAGRVRYDIPSRLFMSNPEGWNKSLVTNLMSAAKFLSNVTIKTVRYDKVIHTEYKDGLIYLDPPYMCNTDFPETSKLYRHNFTMDDHVELAIQLAGCRNRWVLSYDDTPEIRDMYSGFNIYEENWKYSGTCDKKDKKTGFELVITNFT
jgi:DNA adenine methylase